MISALANAGFLAVGLSAATTLVPVNQKGRALAILLSGTTVAMIAGVPLGALLGSALGWRSTFWVIALLCLPAAIGVLQGVGMEATRTEADEAVPNLRVELAQLASLRLLLAMVLGALINGGTFSAFTFVAPVVTEAAGMTEVWVSVAVVLFGLGSFMGVTAAGRLADERSGLVLAVGGPLLLLGWTALAVLASHPGLLLALVFGLGALAFSVGSTLIARVLYASHRAPTMGGSYATAALNVGAAGGPLLGAAALAVGSSVLSPVWVAVGLTSAALILLGFSSWHRWPGPWT